MVIGWDSDEQNNDVLWVMNVASHGLAGFDTEEWRLMHGAWLLGVDSVCLTCLD